MSSTNSRQTNLEVLSQLQEPVRSKALAAFTANRGAQALAKASAYASPGDLLSVSFVWDETSEGYHYWERITTLIRLGHTDYHLEP